MTTVDKYAVRNKMVQRVRLSTGEQEDLEHISKEEFVDFKKDVVQAIDLILKALDAFSEQSAYNTESLQNLAEIVGSVADKENQRHTELLKELRTLIDKKTKK